MIDREGRDKAAEILRYFVTGQITNFNFQDSEPDSKDPIISALWDTLWPFYCDLRKHKMTGEWALPKEGKRKVAIWLLFLYSNEEYQWPKFNYPGALPIEHGFIAKFFRKELKQRTFMGSGTYEIWPFINKESYQNAKNNPVLLSGS